MSTENNGPLDDKIGNLVVTGHLKLASLASLLEHHINHFDTYNDELQDDSAKTKLKHKINEFHQRFSNYEIDLTQVDLVTPPPNDLKLWRHDKLLKLNNFLDDCLDHLSVNKINNHISTLNGHFFSLMYFYIQSNGFNLSREW